MGYEEDYLDLMSKILNRGTKKGDRTGTGTFSLFGEQLKFDLRESFPLLTTKKVWFKGVAVELLWMISGSTNIRPLQEQDVHIWDEWADEDGELGPVYGRQWRMHTGISIKNGMAMPTMTDQLRMAVDQIEESPDSRRIIVSAWDPANLRNMALPPCHLLYQFAVENGTLHCHMYQRSADYFLGVPFNIASYALLTEIVAHSTGLEAGTLTVSFGDVHIYRNHEEQAIQQLHRRPSNEPVVLNIGGPAKPITDYSFSDFSVLDYNPQPAIKAPVSV